MSPAESLDNSAKVQKEGSPQPSGLGLPGTKKVFDVFSILALATSIVCFILACLVVSSWTTIPWSLGLKRQLQLIGLLLSIMNQALLVIMPKFFVVLEACFGKSLLQNFDAILRHSTFSSHTQFFWRLILLASIILPIGLSLAYKEFQQGTSSKAGGTSLIDSSDANFYGLTGPAQYDIGKTQTLGTSLMVNATLPFTLATQEDPPLPQFPQSYGFNTLILSNTSSAALDGPMPDYVAHIQRALGTDDSLYLTANVHATVTSFNESILNERNNSGFWDYYANLSNTTDLENGLQFSNLYQGSTFALLINDLGELDSSFCLLGFVPSNAANNFTNFQNNALLFDTKRAACMGRWRITPLSVSLVGGSCDQPALPESSQNIFTHASLAISQFFMPSLVEYLQPFSQTRNQSQWLVSTFATTMVNAYWARATILTGYNGWGANKTLFVDPNPNKTQRAEVYYHVPDDHLVWERPSMNQSWALYVVLAVQPVLTILLFVADIALHDKPVGRGFGLISLLAGVRTDTLHLLKDASYSGKLRKPLRVKIKENGGARGRQTPKLEYILDELNEQDKLPVQFRLPIFGPHRARQRHTDNNHAEASAPLTGSSANAMKDGL